MRRSELGHSTTGTADAMKGRCRKNAGNGMRGFSITVVCVTG